ncbi:MAG TPA: L,D-transpeptidase [Xanthobacteraceae bacterium]|nr:L,D-transpeptidase [Xanthobacteraceae bacterium]
MRAAISLAAAMYVLGAMPAAAQSSLPFPLPFPPLPGLFDQSPRPPTPIQEERVRYAPSQQPNYGGGFFELLFNGHHARRPNDGYDAGGAYRNRYPYEAVEQETDESGHPPIDPRYLPHTVDYDGSEKPGTVVINTNERFLYLVQSDGTALRYGIGVGRPGFSWAGEKEITMKREWPDWVPPAEMLKRRPELPRYMAGGPDNPLGARAMYLGSSLYRIHGSNEPWTIGTAVSSGCIRMRNEDVTDLYNRVKVGTKVIVI